MTCSTCPLDRVLFSIAGAVTLASILLVTLVSPWFAVLTAFVGVNQLLYFATGACGASIVLQRAVPSLRKVQR